MASLCLPNFGRPCKCLKASLSMLPSTNASLTRASSASRSASSNVAPETADQSTTSCACEDACATSSGAGAFARTPRSCAMAASMGAAREYLNVSSQNSAAEPPPATSRTMRLRSGRCDVTSARSITAVATAAPPPASTTWSARLQWREVTGAKMRTWLSLCSQESPLRSAGARRESCALPSTWHRSARCGGGPPEYALFCGVKTRETRRSSTRPSARPWRE
mmetsp:Transcript_31695/g.111628  ORF Transcript_31695/g.111628 Transcript_31695/m.111628 type:complete len:222 (-) Transcript_31695:147-812(-)